MNDKLLEEAQAAAEAGDLLYREADFAAKIKLKPGRDKAFELVAALRRQSVAGQIVLAQEKIDEMASIRKEISAAADTQSRVIALGKLAVALGRHIA